MQAHHDLVGAGQGLRVEGRCPCDADVAKNDLEPMVETDPTDAHAMPSKLLQSPTGDGGRFPLPQQRGGGTHERQCKEDENEDESTPGGQDNPS